MSYKETGQGISNYKADAKEAERNRKKLLLLIKQPGNNICADCPNKRMRNSRPAPHIVHACSATARAATRCLIQSALRNPLPTQLRKTPGPRSTSASSSASSALESTATSASTLQRSAA